MRKPPAPVAPPGVICLPGQHDGGDGICVVDGTCAKGFTLTSDGVCVPPVPVKTAPIPFDWVSAPDLSAARAHHATALLADGRVLVACGLQLAETEQGALDRPMAEVEIYDPAENAWKRTDSLSRARSRCTATVLAMAGFLCGGLGDSGPIGVAEIYDPEPERGRGRRR